MDTVTYPDSAVREELTRWVLLSLDITREREATKLFEVVAVPVAIAVTPDGQELGRIENFVAPAAFRGRLERLRQ